MKKQILRLSLLSFLLAAILVSCKKKEEQPAPENYDHEVPVHADDLDFFSTRLEAIASDINNLVDIDSVFSGRVATDTTLVCGATYVIDTSGDSKTMTISYDGADCAGRYLRTGVVVISLPAHEHWRDTGAVMTASYADLTATRVADNKTITLNGSHTITNTSGGLLDDLATRDSIVHRITNASMTVRFGDEQMALTWEIARQRIFTFDAGIVTTVKGMRTDGAVTTISEWGTNRFGRPFITAITKPLVFREDCGSRLVSGEVRHTLPVFSALATFGLDANGDATSCPGAGTYYARIEWIGEGNTPQSVIVPHE